MQLYAFSVVFDFGVQTIFVFLDRFFKRFTRLSLKVLQRSLFLEVYLPFAALPFDSNIEKVEPRKVNISQLPIVDSKRTNIGSTGVL